MVSFKTAQSRTQSRAQSRHKKSTGWMTVVYTSLVCATLTIGGAIGSSMNIPVQSQTTPSADQARTLPQASVIRAIREAVKQQFGIQNVNVVSFSEQNWPDGCLGLPRGKEGCTTAIVPGWRIIVSDRMQSWSYRSDRTGNILRLENPNRAVLPQPIARKLIQKVARDNKTISSTLRITEVKAQEFGGCLDIYEGPNQICTANVISGWKAIVTSPNQSFVYHLNTDASRIVQNTTASGAKRSIRVSFESFGEVEPIDNKIVFQSSSSGDLTGRMFRTVLTEDGKLTRYQSSPTARIAPILIKTLSRDQVNAFKKGLETQRFPNFNGLSYLTSAALADYPTTTYQGLYSSVQFIDLEKRDLPKSLKQVIINWEALISPNR
jgi:hypothetical protein